MTVALDPGLPRDSLAQLIVADIAQSKGSLSSEPHRPRHTFCIVEDRKQKYSFPPQEKAIASHAL